MGISDMFNQFGQSLTHILPRSPFIDFANSIGELPFLGWLNWFLPVRDILNVTGIWLGAVAMFYLYQIVLRWLKVIQG